MSWNDKLQALKQRYGDATQFAVTTVLGATLPGNTGAVGLAERAFAGAAVTAEEGTWLDELFDLLSDSFSILLSEVADFVETPDRARPFVQRLIGSDANLRTSVEQLRSLAARLPAQAPAPVAAATGVSAASEIEVPLNGAWYTRPADQPTVDWVKIAPTPGKVPVAPGQVYKLVINSNIPLSHLTRLSRIAKVPQLIALSLWDCSDLKDARLEHVAELQHLQELILSGCELLTEAGLAHLVGLSNMRMLDLNGCAKIKDDGLAHVARLTRLERLDLRGCKRITDAGLAHLPALTSLRGLKLDWHVQVTDAGLEHVAKLTQLTLLHLHGCKMITDAGVAHLRTLANLEDFQLTGCKNLTDAGVGHLRGLRRLQKLYLSQCDQLTDEAMKYLCVLEDLRELGLLGCHGITSVGIIEFQKALPDCKVHHN
jgi:hypothetical protein